MGGDQEWVVKPSQVLLPYLYLSAVGFPIHGTVKYGQVWVIKPSQVLLHIYVSAVGFPIPGTVKYND